MIEKIHSEVVMAARNSDNQEQKRELGARAVALQLALDFIVLDQTKADSFLKYIDYRLGEVSESELPVTKFKIFNVNGTYSTQEVTDLISTEIEIIKSCITYQD